MNRLSALRATVWTPAILAGLSSMPLTAGLHWYWSHYTSFPVFVVGVAVGYYYRHRSKRGIRVGTRMGLVGALPVVWIYPDLLDSLTAVGLSRPVWSVVVEVGPPLLFLLLATGFSTLMGFMGTLAGIKTVHHSSVAAPSSE